MWTWYMKFYDWFIWDGKAASQWSEYRKLVVSWRRCTVMNVICGNDGMEKEIKSIVMMIIGDHDWWLWLAIMMMMKMILVMMIMIMMMVVVKMMIISFIDFLNNLFFRLDELSDDEDLDLILPNRKQTNWCSCENYCLLQWIYLWSSTLIWSATFIK